MTFLRVTVWFFDDRYHGLLDPTGPAEWPPSPFRLFCALVAGVARRGELERETGRVLAWLQNLEPPIIIAPRSKMGRAIRRYVPNNDGDNPRKLDRKDRLTEKLTIPTLMSVNPDEMPKVHYLWTIKDKTAVPMDRIRHAAHSLTALGWGVDIAFADASKASEADIQALQGVRWHPKPGVRRDQGMLRVPTAHSNFQECTLCDLKHCHQTATERIEHGKPLHTVDKPRVFERVFYASVEQPIGRPCRVFELRNVDGESERYPQRKLVHLAGMVRHLAAQAMTKDPPHGVGEDWADTFVAGHWRRGEPASLKRNECVDDADRRQQGEELTTVDKHRQLSYLPLPSIGRVHTDPGVRRIMITAPVGDDAWLDYVARHLAGQMLKPLRGDEFGGDGPPLLVPVRHDDIARLYTKQANIWASVTPVILPGHDDHKPEKTHKLIERALAQSGIEQPCEFEWSAFSRFPKSLSAHKYDKNKKPTGYLRPDYLNSQTAVHLTLRFSNGLSAPGPLVIGAGRHIGLGLMAPRENWD
ncbi:MAG TPA: type I-U CRISPR-associated protein Csb2 [Bryobacteraceae bacterium]|nr:type I-U CRISPR-associated protein Csb2 [Bryobacteraceae bacterium]